MRSLVALSLLLLSSHAAAMSCINTLEDDFRDSRYVMLVEVVAARIEQDGPSTVIVPRAESEPEEVVVTGERIIRQRLLPTIHATVRVIENYKGANPPTELTVTGQGNPEVTVGAVYLVFADGEEASLDCGGMRRVSAFDADDVETVEKVRALADDIGKEEP